MPELILLSDMDKAALAKRFSETAAKYGFIHSDLRDKRRLFAIWDTFFRVSDT